MKTKTIFSLCLIIGMATIKLSAQLPVLARSKSELTVNVQSDLKDVYRNDKQVGSSKIKVTTYDVLRFKHRKLFWENRYTFVEPASHRTDEVNMVKGNDFKQNPKTRTSHYYLIGKKGTTYLGLKKQDLFSTLR
jgi:hypothetical protein